MEGTEELGEQSAPKKPPRKPRPSEIAAKKAKAAKKKPAKPKAKKPAKKAVKAKRPAPKKKKAVKTRKAAPKRPVIYTERIDFRVTKAQKREVTAKAKRENRSVTSIFMEVIERIKK